MTARKTLTLLALAVVVLFPYGAFAQDDDDDANAYTDDDPSALVDFHTTLDPYGAWVDDPTYGTIWVPNGSVVGTNFTPYGTGGHWVYGDDYTWESDYPWGWAPFHYGRWIDVPGRGWTWIAGREYAPAWVNWSIGEPGVEFMGWAPAAPLFFWRGGEAAQFTFAIQPRFAYVGTNDLFAARIQERIIIGERANAFAARMHPYQEAPASGGRRFGGPPPGRIGISPSQVVRPTGKEPGLTHAQQFGRPATATRLGARPPVNAAALAHASGAPGTRLQGGVGTTGGVHAAGGGNVAGGARGGAEVGRFQGPPPSHTLANGTAHVQGSAAVEGHAQGAGAAGAAHVQGSAEANAKAHPAESTRPEVRTNPDSAHTYPGHDLSATTTTGGSHSEPVTNSRTEEPAHTPAVHVATEPAHALTRTTEPARTDAVRSEPGRSPAQRASPAPQARPLPQARPAPRR
jgi:hypothetical protein